MGRGIIIFPHQLYLLDDLPLNLDRFFLVEDSLFFGDKQYPLKFHQQKLVLHRASMKSYQRMLEQKGCGVIYYDYHLDVLQQVFEELKKQDAKQVQVFDPTDFILEKRLRNLAKRYGIQLNWLASPNFLTTKQEITEFFENKQRYHQTDFYIWQRQRLGILLEADGKPVGGSWTYDSQNRQKLPKDVIPPKSMSPDPSDYVSEAKDYVRQNFGNNPGAMDEFSYPIDHQQAQAVLSEFIENKLNQFGPYQDAITTRSDTVFHSLLTPALNVGLLGPKQIIDQVLSYAENNQVSLASQEGFVRQVIGWREFMRAMYVLEGSKIRNSNFFDHKGKLSDKWYRGELGIRPVDDVIAKVARTGYAHHIERLMVLGNFMLLSRLHPDEIYRWFMEMFIDSYDWVMVPNVYSMSQYADGGLLTTKPYVSGSNYIRKMSDYPAGDWCAIWDSLYWSFLSVHKTKLANNPRMSLMLRLLEKQDKGNIGNHLKTSEEFLESLQK